MCGIAGFVDFKGIDPDIAFARSRAAIEELGCRGPDDRGSWADRYCAFAHTRLAIIDLSPLGAQPMARNAAVIAFNGEIYNYIEIRDELIALGHAFKSNSDTEVLLAGWQQWQEGLLPRLNGMFAFAIWDSSSQTLYAARDRFGEKPFLYAVDNDRLAFGSGLIACETMLGEKRPVDPAALRALFTLRFIPEPWSIAQGVRKLLPGQVLRFDKDGLTISRWYDLARHRNATPFDHATAHRELRRRFDAAVIARLVSDVPVGVFLSGGIDSSLVAASVAASGSKLKTFTVGFEGASDYYEERPLAAAVARHLGASHTEIGVSAARAGEVLDNVFAALDEPFADSSAVPTYLVSEATRREVTVVLTGDGADEVFGGYRRYWSELYASAWNRLPGWTHRALSGVLGHLPEGKDSRLSELIRRTRRFVSTADQNPVRRQSNWMRLLSESELDALLGQMPPDGIHLEDLIAQLRHSAEDEDLVNQMLASDVSLVLPGDMLVKVDRMSMAHGLETRAPFLDQRVVEAAFSMPGTEKLAFAGGKAQGKRVLREAFRDRLPAEVFDRPKRGFEIPLRSLISRGAASQLARATNSVALVSQGLFNPQVIGEWLRDFSAGREEASSKLWTLIAFQEWARIHKRPEAMA